MPVSHLLGADGLRCFTALSELHGDGWGMGWYDGGRPHARRSVRRAGEDPDYRRLAHAALGDAGLVHLRRATPGLALRLRNTHPFRYGPYLMAHNGAIHPQKRLAQMLPATWERRLAGTTDSERYLLHLMWRREARGGDMVAAIADTVSAIGGRFAVNSLNAILLSPGTVYVISWHDPAWLPGAAPRERGATEEAAGYFSLSYRVTADAVVAASSGWLGPGWDVLENGSLLMVDRATLAASVVPLAMSAPAAGRPATVSPPTTGRPATGTR